MCGICGIYNLNNSPINRELLDQMTSIMKHRGPDGKGVYIEDGIGLGHRRLSIIDILGGSQPMKNEDGNINIVFNGEIYNFVELREELKKKGHKFSTRSDTEVIIHSYEQWGVDCLNRFNGIFAFALWDAKLKQLFLARDHLGVKPLYYISYNKKFAFASEIKSLLEDKSLPRSVNLEALAQLFTFRYVPSPLTLFNGIYKLPAGHYLLINSNKLEIKQYWTKLPSIMNHQSEKVLIEEYQYLLEDAIRLQLRSDVPVGLFLSSGIDSGAILAIMNNYVTSPIHTFTIGFEDGSNTNETEDARQLAQKYGTNHSEMIVTPQDYQKYFDRYLWDQEEPLGNETAAAFYFVSLIASKHVKVALCGQGADEPWAGYHRYIGVKLSNIYSKIPKVITDGFIKKIVQYLPRNERLKRGVVSLSEQDILTRFTKIYSFYSSEMKSRLFKDWIKSEISISDEHTRDALQHLQRNVSDLDPLSQMLYIDTRADLPDDLLMVGDKTSMANSIEARVPYLDVRLIEFIETLPPHFKLNGYTGKYLHKKAVEKWMPKNVVYRKKKGFANPIDKWLRGKMSSYVNECLLSDQSAVNKYFQKDYIKEILELHEKGKEDYLRHIYLLISFELWHQKFIQ